MLATQAKSSHTILNQYTLSGVVTVKTTVTSPETKRMGKLYCALGDDGLV